MWYKTIYLSIFRTLDLCVKCHWDWSCDEWKVEVDRLMDAEKFCIQALDCIRQWTSFRYVPCLLLFIKKKKKTPLNLSETLWTKELLVSGSKCLIAVIGLVSKYIQVTYTFHTQVIRIHTLLSAPLGVTTERTLHFHSVYFYLLYCILFCFHFFSA